MPPMRGHPRAARHGDRRGAGGRPEPAAGQGPFSTNFLVIIMSPGFVGFHVSLRSAPIVGLLLCGLAAAGSADAQDYGVKLPPGKQAGTFRYEYQGRVRFSHKTKFPAVITLSPFVATDQAIAKKTVETEQPFLLRADLRPGTYIIRSTLVDKDAAGADYWDAFGSRLAGNDRRPARRRDGFQSEGRCDPPRTIGQNRAASLERLGPTQTADD
jgi:hypothetical protein